MNRPQATSDCPPGLEYLSLLNGVKVEQLVDVFEGILASQTIIECNAILKLILIFLCFFYYSKLIPENFIFNTGY